MKVCKYSEHHVCDESCEIECRVIRGIKPKETVTTHIETDRKITQSELLCALKDSMDPLFALLEEKLLEEDGQSLQILVDVKAGKISLKYGVAKI